MPYGVKRFDTTCVVANVDNCTCPICEKRVSVVGELIQLAKKQFTVGGVVIAAYICQSCFVSKKLQMRAASSSVLTAAFMAQGFSADMMSSVALLSKRAAPVKKVKPAKVVATVPEDSARTVPEDSARTVPEDSARTVPKVLIPGSSVLDSLLRLINDLGLTNDVRRALGVVTEVVEPEVVEPEVVEPEVVEPEVVEPDAVEPVVAELDVVEPVVKPVLEEKKKRPYRKKNELSEEDIDAMMTDEQKAHLAFVNKVRDVKSQMVPQEAWNEDLYYGIWFDDAGEPNPEPWALPKSDERYRPKPGSPEYATYESKLMENI